MRRPDEPSSNFPIFIWRAVFVIVTAALFMTWLNGSEIRDWAIWASQPKLDCSSLGRAGVRCLDGSTRDAQLQGSHGADKKCFSAGRGGLICE